MKRRVLTGLLLAFAIPALLVAQSLTELAKEEKERRKKNKQQGEQVEVITEKELSENTGSIANPDAQITSASGNTAAGTREPSTKTADSNSQDDTSGDDSVPEDVAADAALEDKLKTFEAMKAGYQKEVKTIDEEIQKNNERLEVIQEELVSTGGTGLPTAPQADMTPRNPANIPALRNEQQQLRDKNQALETQKQTLKSELIRKGRSAGIPNRYLQF